MDINHNIQFNDDKKLIHFLNIENLSAQQILEILELADTVKSKSLNEKTVASLFFEPSTRTKTTFELAAKRLGVDFINIDIANSSILKGESILDMIKTLEAMECDMFIVRHPSSGSAEFISKNVLYSKYQKELSSNHKTKITQNSKQLLVIPRMSREREAHLICT